MSDMKRQVAQELMDVKINKVQQLNLELMRLASFNDFDGDSVVDDLVANKDLWESVVMGHFDYAPLLCLRDMTVDKETGLWHVDTLYILSSEKDDDRLENLAKTWKADEVDWLESEETQKLLGGSAQRKLLRVWWD